MAEQTWRTALSEAVAELENVETSLDILRMRADALRMTIAGLRSLLHDTPREAKRASAGDSGDEVNSALADLPPFTLRNIEFMKNATKNGTIEGATSTDLAVLLLAGVGRPLSMSQIRILFEYLGWIDPDWKSPSASIHMAVRRAAEKGLARRLPDNRWVTISGGKNETTQATSPTRKAEEDE